MNLKPWDANAVRNSHSIRDVKHAAIFLFISYLKKVGCRHAAVHVDLQFRLFFTQSYCMRFIVIFGPKQRH